MYAEIVFPLSFRNSFTYLVPRVLESYAKTGVRAVAPFGKRILTGFIISTSASGNAAAPSEKIKPLSDIIDDKPVFDEKALEFYKWISDYYLSSLGEALKLAVPYGTEIESRRRIAADSTFCRKLLAKEKGKSSVREKVLTVLSERDEISLSSLQKLVRKKNIYSVLSSLRNAGAITILDELENAKVKVKKEKFISLNVPVGEIYASFPEIESRSPKQVKILLELISRKKKELPLKQLLKAAEASRTSVDSLEQKGFIRTSEKEVSRDFVEEYYEAPSVFKLSTKQTGIIESVSAARGGFQPYLLHGITGSGKTQVYIELVKKVIEKDFTALILVPEISLTPQITSRLYNNFGNQVAVLHSRMSLGERYDSWRKILKGKSKVVIGARSALFAPLKKIGIIIVDEEHDASYKQQDMVPKYNARDAALILAKIYDCPVILGSATPSAESMYNASLGKYKLLELPERVDNAKLPKIHIVNISVEKKMKRMENVFSKFLLDKIEERLKKKEGIIILQNRRGFSTQVYCEDCSRLDTCINCSVPMVFHINENLMKCHYCGFSKYVPVSCSTCGSYAIKFFGTGTERVEDEIDFYFPGARIRRVDSDAVSKKGSLSKILQEFGKGEIDILVGTQMVSKGLDFPRLTLVGVISAETTLWMPDFRSDERTFQLLTQVSGRAGRSKAEGEVVIQTQDEKNFTLQKVVQNDYMGFYQREIFNREKMGYPPFSRLCLIETRDPEEEKAKGAIFDFHKELNAFRKYLKITPPSSALIAKLKGQFRFQILIKSLKKDDPGGKILRKAVIDSFVLFNRKSRYREVKLFFDIDPQNVM